MKNFNIFTPNRRREVAAAAVGAIAVSSLLSGCGSEKGSGGILAEAVGERSSVLSGAKEPTSARECLLELTKAWAYDAYKLPENHVDTENLPGYGFIYRDSEDSYDFRLAAEEDRDNPDRDRIDVMGIMDNIEGRPLVESSTGIMRFDPSDNDTYDTKYSFRAKMSVPRVEGQTPFETLLDSDLEDVWINDIDTPLRVKDGIGLNKEVLEEISTADVDIFHNRDVSEYCSITQEMYDRLD
ncbi:MAG: hypothetical protein Q4B06_03580 [Candidatus Saccharibacteria bacterium]|nr:hypothetical protein [Candidatus Saccharibacteria bacterium]